MVDAADPTLTPDPVEGGDQLQRAGCLAVKRNGQPLPETDLYIRGLVGTLARVARPGVNVHWRLGPWVLEHARFDGTAPQVLVRRVRGAERGRHLDAVLGRVLDLVVPVHPPFTHRGDHLQLRGE